MSEPEPVGAGCFWLLGAEAGAAWNKKPVFMVKKTIILLVYIFCSFTLLVCGEKNILPNLTNSQEPEPVFFGPLEPEPLEKKYQEPKLEPLTNLPAPQPWINKL